MSTRVKNLRGRHIGREVQLDEVVVGSTKFRGVLLRHTRWGGNHKWDILCNGIPTAIFDEETVKLL